MYRLRPAENGSKRLIGNANQVVIRLLGSMGGARRLDVNAELGTVRIIYTVPIGNDLVPDTPCRP